MDLSQGDGEYGLPPLKKIRQKFLEHSEREPESALCHPSNWPVITQPALNGPSLPLGCNPNGSLLDLANKLRWAEKRFGKLHPKSESHSSLSSRNSEQTLAAKHATSAIHVPNMQYPGTNNNINGRYASHGWPAKQKIPNGLEHQSHMPLKSESDYGKNVKSESATDRISYSQLQKNSLQSSHDRPEHFSQLSRVLERQAHAFRSIQTGRKVRLDWEEIFGTRISLMGNQPLPAMWKLLVSTREIRDMDYEKLVQEYEDGRETSFGDDQKIRGSNMDSHMSSSPAVSGPRPNIEDENKGHNMHNTESKKSNSLVKRTPPRSCTEEHMKSNDTTAMEATCDDGLNCEALETAGAITDDMKKNCLSTDDTKTSLSEITEPLNATEMAIVNEYAVNCALKCKTPAKFLAQAFIPQYNLASNLSNRAACPFPPEQLTRPLVVMEPCSKTPNTVSVDTSPVKLMSPSTVDGVSPGDSGREMVRKHHCQHCPYQTDNRSHYRRHLSSVHSIGMPYYCYICGHEFPRSEKVKGHFLKTHPSVTYDPLLVRKEKYFGYQGAGLYNSQWVSEKVSSPASMLSPQKDDQDKMKLQSVDPESNGGSSPYPEDPDAPLDMSVEEGPPLVPENQVVSYATNFSPILRIPGISRHLASPDNITVGRSANPDGSYSRVKPVWPQSGTPYNKKRFYCPQCPYTGKDIWHLKRHINDVHHQRKDLKCPMCDYSTGRKHRLVSHMKNHGELFCFMCDCFRTQNMEEFQLHVKQCSYNKRSAPHHCTHCSQPAMNRKQLQDHAFRIHSIIMFCCEKCMFYTEEREEYEKHEQQHLEHKPNEYHCESCQMVFGDRQTLKHHIRAKHETPPPKPEKGKESEDNMLACSLCNFKTVYRHVMKSHLTVHNGASAGTQCDVDGCNFTAKGKRSLDLHKKRHHPPSPKKSSSRVAATAGTGSCSFGKGKGTFLCPVCKDSRPPFRYKKSFDKHMKQHEEDAESCPLCKEVFYIRASLKQHLQKHHKASVVEADSSSEDDSSSSSSEEDDSTAQGKNAS